MDDSTFRIPKEELKELILLLEPTFNDASNFHILYSERLNDSTHILHVSQNRELGQEEIGICEAFEFRGVNVFVYDTINCTLSIPEAVSSKDSRSPFFVVHAPQWEVLVQRRFGQLTFRKITYFSPYNENLEEVESDTF